MFITKTINESTDMDLEQFDLVDSICESSMKIFYQ